MQELETIRTFDSWRQVPACYATRSQWLKWGRKIRTNEEPTARWISTIEATPDDPREVWLDDPDLTLLVDKEVPLFHRDQTKPVNFTPRTVAYLGYEEIFYEPARKDRHILREGNWITIKAKPGAAFFWASCQLTRQAVRQHVNASKIIGVISTAKTRFIAIDHDFHGNDRDVFLDQAAVLLNHFHGWGNWHYQVRTGEITGMHYILTFDRSKNLKEVTAVLRKRLAKLDEEHPELAAKAEAAGMPSFAKMEIYPQTSKGFRLPLCQGYQMLLDQPLPLTTHRCKAVQDVIAYVNWLSDPARKYMPKQEILDLLSRNLGPSKPAEPATKQPPVRSAVNRQPQAADIGSLKGCCRQKVTGFWSGSFNPQGSLNKFIVITARIFHFEGVAEEDAVRLLGEYVRAIPDDARDCSSRLLAEDWSAIGSTIANDVAKAYSGNAGQGDVDGSNAKLATAVACWRKIGFTLSDKTTWKHGGKRPKGGLHVEWSEEDKDTISSLLGPALGRKHGHLACEVAKGIVNLVAEKHAGANGIRYDYWAAFLRDQYGIRCGNRNTIARIVKACVALGLVEVHCRAIWGERKGMATIYRPGGLARSYNNKER